MCLLSLPGRELYVSQRGQDTPACGSVHHPCRSLRHTVSISQHQDLIYITGAKTAYYEGSDSYTLIPHSLTIRNRSPEPSTISCQRHQTKLFNISGDKAASSRVQVTLEGLTLRDCYSRAQPGLLALANAKLTIKSTVFINNAVLLYHPWQQCHTAHVVIINSTFEANGIKHPYKPGLYLTGCSTTNLNVNNVTMMATQMRLQADYSVNAQIDSLHAIGDSGIYRTTTSMVNILLGIRNSDVTISNSLFTNQSHNSQSTLSITVLGNITQPSQIHLTQISFTNITGSTTRGSALSITTAMPSIYGTNNKLKVNLYNCTFNNNSVDDSYQGGAMYLEKISNVNVNQCTFQSNSATTAGALAIMRGGHIWISNSLFTDNRATSSDATYASHGGALTIHAANVSINNATFINNSANAAGSTIFITTNANLNIFSSVLIGSGSIIHMRGIWPIENAYNSITGSIISVSEDTDGSSPCSVMQLSHLKMKNTQLTCPVGHRFNTLSQPGIRQLDGAYEDLQTFCLPCKANTYSLRRGTSNDSYEESKGFCRECPDHTVCRDGTFRVKTNFWAEEKDGSTAIVARCPVGYCCTHGACHIAKICEGHRHGRLCGHCEENFTLPINHNYCVPMNSCKSTILWLSIVFSTIIYVVIMIMFSEITQLFVKLFTPFMNIIKYFMTIKRNVKKITDGELTAQSVVPINVSENTPLLKREHEKENAATYNDDINSYPESGGENEERESVTQTDENKSTENEQVVFISVCRLLFHIYQIAPLFYLTFTSSPKKFHPELDTINAFFHFLPMFLNSGSQNMCPDFRLDFSTKQFVEVVSVVMTPLSILCLYLLLWLAMSVSLQFSARSSLRSALTKIHARMSSAFTHALLLSYVSMTLLTFKLTSCVNVGGVKVMFFEGTTECGQWWHWLLLSFALVHLFPTVLVFFLAPPLLARSAISLNTFLCCFLLPAPMTIYLVVKLLKEISNSKKGDQKIIATTPLTYLPAIREILKIMCQSFVKSKTGIRGIYIYKVNHNCHEAIWLMAKFIFVLFYSTLSYKPLLCAIVQLVWFTCVSCCLLLTNGHTACILRHLERLLLLLLAAVIVLNLIPAVFYENGTTSTVTVEHLNYLWPIIASGILAVLALLVILTITLYLSCYLLRYCKDKKGL